MPYRRNEETGDEIRRVALQMFAEQGYDGTSIRDVAARVGIRGASMYHHFESKEAILWELTETALLGILNAWRETRARVSGADPVMALRAFVRTDVLFHAENRTAAVIVNSQLNRLSPEHYRRAVELRQAYEDQLVAIVSDCVATGYHQVPNVRVTVFAILQMTVAITGWYRPDGPLALPQLADIYEELAVKMLAPLPAADAVGKPNSAA